LKTKQKQLKLQDKGNKPKRACPPTDEEINILYNRNVKYNLETLKLILRTPPKSEYFFQQHWESEYFFRKKNPNVSVIKDVNFLILTICKYKPTK
jgi:hypothetical protein